MGSIAGIYLQAANAFNCSAEFIPSKPAVKALRVSAAGRLRLLAAAPCCGLTRKRRRDGVATHPQGGRRCA